MAALSASRGLGNIVVHYCKGSQARRWSHSHDPRSVIVVAEPRALRRERSAAAVGHTAPMIVVRKVTESLTIAAGSGVLVGFLFLRTWYIAPVWVKGRHKSDQTKHGCGRHSRL